jgi:hypothetical protein
MIGMLACAAAAIAVPKGAAAEETHFNCATFDNQGGVISVTPNCSQTISIQGGTPVVQPGAVDPCTGNPGTLTLSFTHQVFHVNVNGAGDLWITGTQNGVATFVPYNTAAPSGDGPWTSWFGGSNNNQNAVYHSTLNARVHFPNGVTASLHEVFHITFSGTGTITSSFDKGSALTGGTCN